MPIPVYEIVAFTRQARGAEIELMERNMDAAYAAMAESLNDHPYGDGPDVDRPVRRPTWRQRFALKMQQVRDAWDVLRGRADIG